MGTNTQTNLITRVVDERDLDRVRDIGDRSFGRIPDDRREQWHAAAREQIAAGRLLGVYDGDTLVGSARLRPFQQFWGGRPLPMSGVASVGVAPEYRGRGAATTLMRAVAVRGRDLGEPVSALYPATFTLYRKLGWEIAGSRYRYRIDTSALRGLGGRVQDVPVRPATPDDADTVNALIHAAYANGVASGPRGYSEAETRDLLANPGLFCYLAERGFVAYGWEEGNEGGSLSVRHLAGTDEQTLRALWATVGSGSSTAKTVRAYLGPQDPLQLLLSEEIAHETEQTRWMLRVLDLEAAIARRGFPAGVRLEVPITIEDEVLQECAGSWLLRVADGRGAVSRRDGSALGSQSADLQLGATGLAALYAGTPTATLRAAGLATGGDPAYDAALDSAFAATPYLLEYF
ncbi:MAG: GNAT family N-acetyltransferase [Nocardioidaceae bacterium]